MLVSCKKGRIVVSVTIICFVFCSVSSSRSLSVCLLLQLYNFHEKSCQAYEEGGGGRGGGGEEGRRGGEERRIQQ